jgi:glycerophosphoryl diester phosphodiesterase
MKKIIFLLMAVAMTLPAQAWRPLVAGHRGGPEGVENTAVCFTNGATKYGYDGLECDIRVTSDGAYVISHDETTNRLGGSLTVASSTLAQLQAENYTQTRYGVTYTGGKICLASEYLDICKQYSCYPLIELKWTTGINNNDMSNFAGLLKLITDRGLEGKVVFLTSMKTSLEYIKAHYPNLHLQFLCTSAAATSIDWCKTQNIEPSIGVGYFDQALLQKYHNAGFNIAAWTVESLADYKKYAGMGIYMITTTSLNKNNLPQVDEHIWDTVKVPDPIKVSIKTIWKRTLNDSTLPTNFPSGAGTYAGAQEAAITSQGTFLANDYKLSKLIAFTGTSDSVTVSDGLPTIGITTDDADNVIQRAESTFSTTAPSALKITTPDGTTASVTFTLPTGGQTNFITASGDVTSSTGGYVYLFPNSLSTAYAVHIANSQFKELLTFPKLSITSSTAGMIFPVSASDPAHFYYLVRNKGFYEYCDTIDNGVKLPTTGTTAPTFNSSVGGAIMQLDGHDVLVHGSGLNYMGGFSLKDLTVGVADLGVIVEPMGTLVRSAYSNNPSTGSFFKVVKVDDSTCRLLEYCMGHGYREFEITTKNSGIDNVGIDRKTAVTAYPNPASGTVNVSLTSPIKEIAVYTTAGKMLARLKGNGATTQTVDFSAFPIGAYILKVNGNSTIIMKR